MYKISLLLRTLLVPLLLLTHAVGHLLANNVYVTSGPLAGTTVSVIDTNSNTIVATIPGFNVPTGVAVTPNGAYAYVVNSGADNVLVIDTTSNTIVATIPSIVTLAGLIAITPDGAHAYVTTSQASSPNVYVIETSSNTASALPGFHSPSGIAITPDGAHVYVTNKESPFPISVLRTSDNTLETTIPITVNVLAITPDGKYLYATDSDNGIVYVIATSSNSVIATVPGFTALMTPGFIAIPPEGTHAYIANVDGDTVSVVSTSSNTIVDTIPGFQEPVGMAVSSDGKYIYVANHDNQTVAIIEISSNSVIATIPGFTNGAYFVATTPSTAGSPQHLTGQQQKNDFGLEYELFNLLQWEPTPGPIDGYFIYRDGNRIASVPSSTIFYKDHNRKKGVSYAYSVTAFTEGGGESSPIRVTVP